MFGGELSAGASEPHDRVPAAVAATERNARLDSDSCMAGWAISSHRAQQLCRLGVGKLLEVPLHIPCVHVSPAGLTGRPQSIRARHPRKIG